MSADARDSWDAEAARFDEEPDHGLRAERVRHAWWRLLSSALPPPPPDVVDLGCGTGSLAVLLAQQGYQVRALDFSEAMLSAARRKAAAADVPVDFTAGDAAEPPFEPDSCDVVLGRHVLWALPEPATALRRWVRLLRPDGRLVLIEGAWSTGAGIPAAECADLVRALGRSVTVQNLADPDLWGRRIDDERYLLVSLPPDPEPRLPERMATPSSG